MDGVAPSHTREPFACTQLCLAGLLLAIASGRSDRERCDQLRGCCGDLAHRGFEGDLVRARGTGGAAQLAHELKRGGSKLFSSRWRVEISERPDVATHREPPLHIGVSNRSSLTRRPLANDRGTRRDVGAESTAAPGAVALEVGDAKQAGGGVGFAEVFRVARRAEEDH